MPTASQRPLLERLWMACVALLFLVQPIASAGNCTLRARVLGLNCCCASTPEPEQKPSCCSKRAGDEAPARPAQKRCGCELNAPPLVPPSSTTQVPGFLGELARALELPNTFVLSIELARPLERAHAPPGFASCFHARLDAGMARALAFERTLRC